MDPTLVRTLTGAGRLPVLASMLSSWDVAPTRNPLGLVVGGLWPNFWSGVGPGHHGSYCFRQVVPGGWETSDVRPTDIDAEPFWAALDRDGHSCTIIDVPLLPARPLTHGRVVGDWGTHDRQLPFRCEPATLAETVGRLGGVHPIDGGRCDALVEQEGHGALKAALHAGIDQRVGLLRGLLTDDDDLFVTAFSESHCAGHHFWHLHDQHDPQHDPSLAEALGGNPLAEIYDHLDRSLGELLGQAGDRPAMVLLSHGIGAHNDANHLLDDILLRIERAHFPGAPPWVRARTHAVEYGRAASRHLRRRTGWGDQPVPRRIGRLDGTRRWYAVPNNDLYGGIRFNREGREPVGRIAPAEVEDLTELLTAELRAVVNDETGRPAVREVIRCDDHHPGPRRSWLPDLFVTWDWSAPHRSLSSPTIGTVVGEAEHVRTGDHRPAGLVLTRGVELDPGRPVPVERLGAALVAAARAG